MARHTDDTAHEHTSTDAVSSGHGRMKRLIIALTVLACILIGVFALYAISFLVGAVILLLLSGLLAYLLSPLVQFLQRHLPHPLAIAVAYLLVAGALVVVMYIVTSSLIRQASALAQSIQYLLIPAREHQLQPVIDSLGKLGIPKDQVIQFENQLLSQVQSALSGVLPFLISFFSNIINLMLVVTLSVYFVIDGPRIVGWLRLKTPLAQRESIKFLLSALDQSLGEYFRGSLLLAFIRSSVYQCGARAAPRPISRTVGVHPIVALLALVAGAELFGLLGGFLSLPVAGVLQQIIVAVWRRWEQKHPDQFPPEEVPPQQSESVPGQEVAPTDTAPSSRKP
jgi:predicted PurR-regulated permease PerM